MKSLKTLKIITNFNDHQLKNKITLCKNQFLINYS